MQVIQRITHGAPRILEQVSQLLPVSHFGWVFRQFYSISVNHIGYFLNRALKTAGIAVSIKKGCTMMTDSQSIVFMTHIYLEP